MKADRRAMDLHELSADHADGRGKATGKTFAKPL